MDINYALIVGRLTRDPEKRATTNGTSVASFTIATKGSRKDQDGIYMTEFINCVAWGQTADNIAKHCMKGDELGVIGEIRNNNREVDGVTHYRDEINVRTAHFGQKAKRTAATAKDAADLFGEELADFAPAPASDLPF